MKKLNCVQIELTNNCNYRCKKCPRSATQMTRKKGFADFEMVKRLLDESYKIARFVNFSFFGEPLLHPKFIDIIEYTKNKPKGFKVIINSNMSLMTKEIMHKLIDCRLSQLRISIDAVTNKTYDLVRSSSFCLDLDGNKIKSNRLDVIDEKVRYWFSLKRHVPTRHVFPVSSLNKHETRLYVDKWYPLLGAGDQILLKSILTYGGKISDSEITPNPCNIWELGLITIDWQGNASPCNLDTNMDLIIGNVSNKSIMEALKSKKYKELKSKSKRREIFPCNKCIDANNYTKNIRLTNRTKLNEKLYKRIETRFR